jgi:iron-sulfur cluster assembly protein
MNPVMELQADTQQAPVQNAIQVVSATPNALTQFKNILTAEQMAGIRLSVVGGGCAGLQYKMDPAIGPTEGDLVQELEGVRFYVHPMAAPYLKGISIDFEASLIDGGFKFMNPNATSTCGCGTSFGI